MSLIAGISACRHRFCVPAPFTLDVCGYRIDRDGNITDKPNTSDAGDDLSIELGTAFFQELGVPKGKAAQPLSGDTLEEKIVDALRELRPDLRIERSRAASEFRQYAHLDVFPQFRRSFGDLRPTLSDLSSRVLAAELGASRRRIEKALGKLSDATDEQARLIDDLNEQMPEESLLKIDVSVAIPHPGEPDELAIALSSKWSLRTDRAQDCVSQGSKLVAQRRGMMPHFGVITIEPRPSMLRIIADGSGAIDYVYHLDLPALSAAINGVAESKPARWSPKETFGRLMRQRRLRDFDELVYEVSRVPGPD
ncbi:type II site-specific deoxyribonuclease [Mycobacterium vicinigordonae]|uniref:Type II site-specific deoxyribonuclease n=1 Tax=Mycobacterium vicinigordonae TaxID=1719132 RepID=A0A7D6E1Q0_9MYCO|nr:type II site-specific deoxyribonuclease [Mycobacterium vicinigordonae]